MNKIFSSWILFKTEERYIEHNGENKHE